MSVIEKLQALLAKATPGPWEWDGSSITNWHDYTFEMEWIDNGFDPPDGVNANRDSDAALIVAAVNALPELLDVAEAARPFAEGKIGSDDYFARVKTLHDALSKLTIPMLHIGDER